MTTMTHTMLPTGRAAGPAPSGPPTARAGAPPGFHAALDSAAQTWTAHAEGHTDNARPRNDAAATKANRAAIAARHADGRAADADDATRSAGAARADAAHRADVARADVATNAAPSADRTDDPVDATAATAPVADHATDAPADTTPVAPDASLLALLGAPVPVPTAMTLTTKLTAPATVVPSATPPMVGATAADLASAAQLSAVPKPTLDPAGTMPAASELVASDGSAASTAAANALAATSSVSDLLSALAPTGAPAKLPASDLDALLGNAAVAQAAATSPDAASSAPAAATTAGTAAANALPALGSPTPDALVGAAAATAATAAPIAADPASPLAAAPAPTATATDATALAATAAGAAPATPAPAPATPQLSPLAQAIQAAATQQQSGGGSAQQGRSGGKESSADSSAAAVATAATTPADAGAPLAGAQVAAGMTSTPAAPVVPTGVHAANPSAQAAAIEALVHLSKRQGTSAARIQLAPETLGGIQVTLTFGSDGVSARLIADRPEAAAALGQAGQDLRDSLQNQGIDLARLETGFAGSMGQQGNQNPSSGAMNGFGDSGSRNRGSQDAVPGDTTLHLALDDQPATQQPLAAGRTIDLRA